MPVAGRVEPFVGAPGDLVILVSHDGGSVAETTVDRPDDALLPVANEVFLE
jgi:hypothetical protein